MAFSETAGDPSAPPAVKRWSRRTILAAAVLTGVAVTAGAAAEPAPATRPDSTVMQNRLSDLNTWILTQPDVHANGYVASVNDAQTGSTILLWHGEANQTQKAITEKAAQLGITVTVRQRKYSLADLTRGQKALHGLSGRGPFANFTINSTAGVTADFDGIIVHGDYIDPPARGRTEADAVLAAAASQEIGVTVSIQPGGIIVPA
ncbi:hypothetical protein JCM9534A_02390 [Catenuloplanes indicus JCM 9534]